MKPGILLMARALHYGGSERQLTETALGLDRSRFRPHVGTFWVEGMRADELRAAGVPILHLPLKSYKSPTTITSARMLAGYIRDHDIQLVHAFDRPMNAFAIPITRYLTSAIALASQRSHLSLAGPYQRRFVLFAERRAHGVVVNCEYLRTHLIHYAGIASDRIHLCYNGLDLTRFRRAPASRPSPLPAGALVIGVVSVLRPEKGLPTLLDAFAEVLPEAPNARLLILGSGPVLPELQARARELQIVDRCHFEPSTDLVDDWLQSIDIFVLPSISEALSNALMEAMACGCCPIASRVGGNPELIEDGVRGLLFEPGNSTDLARKLRAVISGVDLRARLAQAAHEFVHTNFSRKTSAERMAAIYLRLLAENGSAS
jgi:glycosyltransferase involved in cell wall biosynthesis